MTMRDVYGRPIAGDQPSPIDVRASLKEHSEFVERRRRGRLVAGLVYDGFSITQIMRRTGLTRNVVQNLMNEFCAHEPKDIKKANQRVWVRKAIERGMTEAAIVREMRVERTLVRSVIEEMHRDERKRLAREAFEQARREARRTRGLPPGH